MSGPAIWGGGEAYERYIGRWSRRVAAEFVDWLAVEPGRDWLDIGAGTGALSQAILERCAPASVTGVDPAEGFVEHAREAVAEARFEVGGAQSLPFDDDEFDVAVSGLVLNFVPDADAAITEAARVLRADGVGAAYVWDYAERMQLIRVFFDVATALDPSVRELDEGERFPLCRPEPLRSAFEQAFHDVEVRPIEVPTRFADFDDYWEPFLGGQGPAPAYVMSLDEEHRAELREALHERLGDGPIDLVARAWAVRGRA